MSMIEAAQQARRQHAATMKALDDYEAQVANGRTPKDAELHMQYRRADAKAAKADWAYAPDFCGLPRAGELAKAL